MLITVKVDSSLQVRPGGGVEEKGEKWPELRPVFLQPLVKGVGVFHRSALRP